MKKISSFLLVITLIFSACSSDDGGGGINPDSFDREGMLKNWADNIIVPSFENFSNSTQSLEDMTNAFVADPSEANLIELRAAFQTAYLDFQTVSMFEIGKGMELNFRNFLNTYPANVTNIESKIEAGGYNLTLPSSYAEQGFPALDYLLYGVAGSDAEIVSVYSSEKYQNYLKDVASRINSLSIEMNTAWQGELRDNFVNNTSSSSTGSIDIFTNDYIMYFEKFIRSGKIGYPAGAFTGDPMPQNVEAYYSEDLSKKLYIRALESFQDFFSGKHFGSSETGKSYSQYLDYMESMKESTKLSALINSQLDLILSQAETLDTSLKSQVETNNTSMLEAFDELQKAVVLLKVDMVQALYIGVDYVDSDGD